MILVGIDGTFLVFGDGNVGLLCWFTLDLSDNGIICSIGCIIFFELNVIVY